jgi:ATP-dependent DNA helicase RecG
MEKRTLTLLDELRQLPAETSWLEFKENNTDALMIGKLISALSNAARLADQPFGYVLWGIRDGDCAAVGTRFEPISQLQQNQPLELWLAQRLQPAIAFNFKSVDDHGTRLVMLEIPAAISSPVEFDRQAFIRTYFDLTAQPLPDNRNGIFDKLLADHLVQVDVGGHWNITNLGAVLFAKRLADFPPSMARKAIRFVAYGGLSRADAVTHRQDGQKGYAVGFTGLIDFIDSLIPRNEFIGKAFREECPLYPAIAIRELVANALIHQDMIVTGAGPLVEMFSDRLEITNPGQPLVKPERFLDFPPRSRNEALASLMRRMRLCEEQGTGIDKVIVAVELHQLPPPDFRAEGDAVRAVLYAPRRFAEMTSQERMRACYQHAALKYVSGQRMKNASLSERLGIDSQNAAQASVVIRQALAAKLIRSADPTHPRAGYVPFWA